MGKCHRINMLLLCYYVQMHCPVAAVFFTSCIFASYTSSFIMVSKRVKKIHLCSSPHSKWKFIIRRNIINYYSQYFSLNGHQHTLPCTYFLYWKDIIKKILSLEVEILFPTVHTDSLITASGL